ncbi:MAG TPA: hypothetical protein VNA17_08675 [Pyrinomonadaceae bacterium]|nr:hypothetical protein [Pyrinomonadaceae bacterium]
MSSSFSLQIRCCISGQSGFYTLPDPAVPFPYGVKTSPVVVSGRRLPDWTRREVVLMRGIADVERTANLRQSPEVDAQGKTRFEPAGYVFSRV